MKSHVFSDIGRNLIHHYGNCSGNPDDVADDFGRSALYFKLGYFSLIGLLRTHVLLGDYHQALKTVENLELDPKV